MRIARFAKRLPTLSIFNIVEIWNEKQALACLAALAHETRFVVFRLLVRQAPPGLPAGEIARRLAIAAPTLSFHLKELERAGLIGASRRQRQILYATDFAGTRELLDFLMRDCCQGDPLLCGPMAADGCGSQTELRRESPMSECVHPARLPRSSHSSRGR